MKKKHITIWGAMPLLSLMILLAACSQEITPLSVEATNARQDVKIRFNVARTAFDSQETTRSGGSGTGWENGETVYLRFDEGAVKGTAVFKTASNDWEVKVNGDLSHDVSGKVEAYYFDKPVSQTASKVSMDATTGVYHATDGSYKSYANGDLDIAVTLKPITGRIRFAGQSGVGIEVEGLRYYTGYDVANNQLTASTAVLYGKTTTGGYTPYYYCEFAENSRRLSVYSSKDGGGYVKSFAAAILKTGESGYVSIPTEGAENGWTGTLEKKFTVTGNGKTVSFKMKVVEKGTFQMGAPDEGIADELPVHSVTLTKDYYMGETEVTQGLWYAVMGQNSYWHSLNKLGDDYPAYFISYEDCEQFLTNLNKMTGLCFRLPTEAEWEFAAKGGNRSKGYTYAGSNVIENVAWYSQNSYDKGRLSPDYGTHVVKTKASNELGIYDMSGNVLEWCYDWYGSYSSSVQVDPAGPASGSERVYRGGSWGHSGSSCRCTFRDKRDPSVREGHMGFRLAL